MQNMANPDKSKQKIFKAKKTMSVSSRKQMNILKKSKNVEALKTTESGKNIPDGNSCFSPAVISSNRAPSETVDSSFDSNNNSVFPQKSIASSQNLIRPEEIVGSETRLKNTDEQMCLYQNSRVTIDSSSKFSIQESKDSQNTKIHCKQLYSVSGQCIDNENEKNHKQKSLWYPPIVLNGTAENTLDDKRIDKVASSLKANSSAESHDKSPNDILSLESYFVSAEKTPPNLVSSVSSNNSSATTLKTKDLCRTCPSSTSNCEHEYLEQLSLLNINSSNGHNQKKRVLSQNKENVKRLKTSEQINDYACVSLEKQTALLEQVKHFIRQEICRISFKVLDQKLDELSERIGKTQCRSKHEAIACELFVKIGRLQRRMEAILPSQTDCLEPTTLPSNTVSRIANSKTKNVGVNQKAANGPNERVTSVNLETSDSSEKTNQRINLSSNCVEFVSESNTDDVMLISVENPNLKTPITSRPTENRKTTLGNFNNSPNAKIDVGVVEKKLDFVIDLTREHPPNCNMESWALASKPSSRSSIPQRSQSCMQSGTCIYDPNVPLGMGNRDSRIRQLMGQLVTLAHIKQQKQQRRPVSKNPVPTLMPLSEAVLNSKEITAMAESGVEDFGSFTHLPPLPEPPSPPPELADKIQDTLPPQKPELRVKRILRPWGIALIWNISKINLKCAPVESYHLFLCYESSEDSLTWKKIAEIKALPLPMACTLSQILTANKYYFTIQSKDIFGRYGPFCDIKSIPGFSENLI